MGAMINDQVINIPYLGALTHYAKISGRSILGDMMEQKASVMETHARFVNGLENEKF